MRSDGNRMSAHRVVIIGGGFGGVRAARALERAPVQITLIDRTNHHLFQPLLYQVATGVLSAGQIAPALRSLFRHQQNVSVMLGEVQDIDLERRVVRVVAVDELEVPYDTLMVAAGATHSYLGREEWSELAPGMKTLDDATRLRTRILGAFELAEQESEPAERQAWLTFVIVGAGPTGVELAGQISLLAHRVLRGEYRHIDARWARVVLLDAVPGVLSTFPEKLSEAAERELRGLGVDVELQSPVVAIDRDGVEVESARGERRRIDARTVIWAAGVKASRLGEGLAEGSGAQLDRAGRLQVEADLSLPGHPEVFAIGDMISIPGVPGTAQPAIQEGKYVASVIRARLEGEAPEGRFRYRDLGTMATVGRSQAVADLFGRIRLWGFPGFLIWGVVHLAYLVGWGNRFGAVARWMWTILARNRRERLISVVSLASEEAGRRQLHALRGAPRPARRETQPTG
jgi:NADH:ubiquinone reductase (H+-translocating)